MEFIKEYKQIKIFKTSEDLFYCDVINNSSDPRQKTFGSKSLLSIEKSIDLLPEEKEMPKNTEFFDINISNHSITKLMIVDQIGSKKFFDDGSDTSEYGRKSLYPHTIQSQPEFEELQSLFMQINNCQKQIDSLIEIRNNMDKTAKKTLEFFKKVNV